MISRRDLIKAGAFATLGGFGLPLNLTPRVRKPFRMAVITDLHFGLAPDAGSRLDAFVEAVKQRDDLDLVMQLGDFCYSGAGTYDYINKFNRLPHPKIHVLGNHDMDKCDKKTAMAAWDMESRYGIRKTDDYNFIWLDLNHFQKEGKLVAYEKGNYFTDNATFNMADPEQLAWLEEALMRSRKPVILLSHQPLGFAEPGQPLPVEQQVIVDLLDKCAKANPKGRVVFSMFGHLHVDRLERVANIPFYCVNSASYFWSSGMWAYSKPLFAFMEIDSHGVLRVEGILSEFVKTPPASSDGVIGRSASISSRNEVLIK